MVFNFQKFGTAILHQLQLHPKYKGFSIRLFASEIGLSAPTVSRVTRGNRADIDTVLLICYFLDLDLNNFID